MKLQQLVIDKLTGIIEDAGLTATVEKDYSNTGYILALNDKLDTQWSIRFDFQTTYFTLELFDGSTVRSVLPTVRASTINGASNSSVIDRITTEMSA